MSISLFEDTAQIYYMHHLLSVAWPLVVGRLNYYVFLQGITFFSFWNLLIDILIQILSNFSVIIRNVVSNNLSQLS
jgi:hypothetical protein